VTLLWNRLATLPLEIIRYVLGFITSPYPWKSIPKMSTKRYLACAATLDGKVIVMGGCNDDDGPLTSCEMIAATVDGKVIAM